MGASGDVWVVAVVRERAQIGMAVRAANGSRTVVAARSGVRVRQDMVMAESVVVCLAEISVSGRYKFNHAA